MTRIETIGICGAGVMGSQLAAFLASAGFQVRLFDLKQELAEGGLRTAGELRPAPFYHKRFAKAITPCNYDDHAERFGECDWIIEAIAERLDWKLDLYRRIQPHLKPDAVLSSNTSGLPLGQLVEPLDEGTRARFLITHFFNPPRYMRLVEVVPGSDTNKKVLQRMEEFIGKTLGKGIVNAKDTPNFIANRIGVYGMMLTLQLTQQLKLSVEQVDAVTGPVMGRPNSATYRTADLVGLDTLAAVAHTSHERCPDDEARELFEANPVLEQMIERKTLGQKTKAGFFKKEGKEILVLDLDTMEYRPRAKPRMDGIGVARRFTDLRQKIHALVYNADAAGKLAWELTASTLCYAANRVGEIADDIVNVDNAMKWGYGWQLGPFEVWDAIGVEKSARRMESEGKPVPELARNLLDSGAQSFYERNESAKRCFFDMQSNAMSLVPVAPDVVVLSDEKARGGEILRNWSASLVDIGDDVGCVEFHSALQPEFNPLDGAILDMVRAALDTVGDRKMKGLVISHEGTHFCAGANLALILELAKAGQFERLEQVSKAFQDITQAIKYAPFPVVAAPFGLCLGGGFEMIAACRKIVALAELYCGAVEVGVGLIPGAAGTLRLLSTHTDRQPPRKCGPMVPTQKAFETIAFAKVATSAHEAIGMGYLRKSDRIVLSRDHQIAEARNEVLSLADGYAAPEPPELVPPGDGGRLAIEGVVDGFRKAGTISDHDALIGKKLAYVLTGGERADGIQPVDEQYLLDLERETFVSLAAEEKSQARMAHMLKTGKPLRN
jgi:3-hydroxyacyl-CoA dehydrogenase